jgi:hypothetical protein
MGDLLPQSGDIGLGRGGTIEVGVEVAIAALLDAEGDVYIQRQGTQLPAISG